ncbi:MAG: sigma-54 dependent transcriptional regulator [Polyangiales bacterium]
MLLIDDDDALIPEQVRSAFPEPTHRVDVVHSGGDGLAKLRAGPRPEVILLDLRLPDQSGLEVFEQIRAIDARIPVIFVTMAKAADSAIDAMKRGAFDYLYKPLDLTRLRKVVDEAAAVARLHSPVVLASDTDVEDVDGALSGTCAAMSDVYKGIGRVAAQDVTVLITGESGTGKELVARAIYQHSARAKAPFLALNCAAIPEALLESELFGHEKGAFTGADRRRIGKFEQCRGGTILLDEIGDMPLGLQAKILRLLQEQTFERVGGSETIKPDVRIIAATHRDLKARAAGDRFRPDLYYRLSVFTIQLPSLRERGDDLPLLIGQYLRRFNRELGRNVRELAPETLERLRGYAWPGNIRELQSVLKIALLNATGPVLLPGFLPPLAEPEPPARKSQPPALDLDAFIGQRLHPEANDLYAETHGQVDRLLFTRALEYTRGNHRDAAKLLGISRQTMRVKLRALGLHVAHTVESDEV